jgi:charged multivesicular body protein 4
MNIFGRPKPKAAPAVDIEQISKTTASLRTTLSTLEKRQQLLKKKIDQQLDEARAKSAAKDKKGALFCLKRKKMYENEINKIDGARINIESQVMALESSISNVEIVNSMRTGQKTLASIHKAVNVDEATELMDDIHEEMATADELNNAISQPIGGVGVTDDDELMAELDELEGLAMEEEMLQAPSVSTAAKAATGTILPSAPVPSKIPDLPLAPSKKVEIEDDPDMAELKALEAEFA